MTVPSNPSSLAGDSGADRRHASTPIPGGRPLRILWVKVGGLWPLNTGGRLRSFHVIRELSKNHAVTVLTTHGPEEDGGELARQLPQCEAVRSLPHTPAKRGSPRFVLALARSWLTRMPVDVFKSRVPALEQAVKTHIEEAPFDLVIADFLVALPNVPLGGPTPVVYFSHNVEYMIWRRLAETEQRLPHRLLLAQEWRKMRRFELAASRRTALTVAVSEQDRDQLSAGSPGARIEAIATGVDLDYFQVGERRAENPLKIVFCGSMDWHPNEDAMRYFMDAVLPRIRERQPAVEVTIVGRNPSGKLRAVAEQAGVRVTGTVPDVRPHVQGAAVYIVPLRIGGGTRLKIYEALAMGKAVVSTTIGAEGLPLEEGRHIVRADEPVAFAREVLALLEEPERRQALGDAGRALMEERFSWSRVAEEFEQHCRAAMA